MSGRVRRWGELVRSLGRAILELLQAEVAALGEELAASGRELRRGGVYLILALAVGVAALWALALLLFELLVLVLPRWGAAGTILLALTMAALGFFIAGRRALGRVQDPRVLVARRAREHADWWHGLLGGEVEEDGDEAG
ncbi:MAG: phage holin family protein [Thermoanaerobaculia bacterium]